ncbi:hypothetical protein [Streptomyces sp. NPDC052042]|uniref:hypothetical protein n=1 Tax=Streptomyces sp. NPDC052042 TaxID=3365683 RepID=UPI0037D73CE3
MSTGAGTVPGPDDSDAYERPGAKNSYRDNQQRLDRGMAVMGGITGDVTMVIGASSDESVTDHIVKPRLREGPYPADDVLGRLRAFVEPPAYTRCRKMLDGHVLVLRAGAGTGASTAAFALLAERHGPDGITGLDSSEDLSRWRPAEGRGYLLQSLSPAAADPLGEVVLTALTGLLRRAGAHLVITVRKETPLPVSTTPWQVVHHPPPAAEVATKGLNTMFEAGELTVAQRSEALKLLASSGFAGYLHAHPLPRDAVGVAHGLREVVVSGKDADSVLDDLRTGSPAEAHKVLAQSRHRADDISLMAAVSLLSGLDRTVVEGYGAVLRPLVLERCGPAPAAAGAGQLESAGAADQEPGPRRDVLGPAFEDRLAAVGARLLPARVEAGKRYPVQPVAFSGRHRSESLLRCLWLDYEGMAGLLWRALAAAPHHPGVELAAGQAIGRVLAHATGPDALRQLQTFAGSEKRWHRRLVAYALGEVAQYPALTGAVREQLRLWSQAAHLPLRCTVAETCGGGYGLARPPVALKLLDAALDGPSDTDLERGLRSAVSFALGTLLSERANHGLVLAYLWRWQEAEAGTPRHALAAHVIGSMSLVGFPRPGTSGAGRLRLAGLLTDHPEQALRMVVKGLDDPVTHTAVAQGLSLIENDPDERRRTAFPRFLAALSGTARGHRGVMRFVLGRHRTRTGSPTEGFAS